MKRIAALAASLALAAAPVAVLAQEAEAPAVIVTDWGAQLLPVPGWTHEERDGMLIFTAPEGDATFALVGVDDPKDARDAIAQAWAKFDPSFDRPIYLLQEPPPREGWDYIGAAAYETSPAEQLVLQASAARKGDRWNVVLLRGAVATVAKRAAQLNQSAASIRPADFQKETFAGKPANALTSARIAELTGFLEEAMQQLEVPGAGLALIQDDRIVWEGGLGVRAVGSDAPVDKDTSFMIASNTKGMATLLLATLVDEGRLKWDQKVTEVYPAFRLGSQETTDKVLIEHLICACTGLPRKDMQFVFNTGATTPASDTFAQLAATQPTSGFGEVFQYNNLMASAAGYIGGHILYPQMELGAAFDRAMEERIFEPLGMDHTTFDYAEAMAANWAQPYARGFGGPIKPVPIEWDYMVRPYRPAGGAWSTAHDMALYTLNELREGKKADGSTFVSAANLLKRRAHSVPIGEDAWYGMGLMENASKGKSIFDHGGSLLGYKSDFWFIPEDGVGAVLLTNSDTGQTLLGLFQRKLLEVLYDGKAEAAETLAAAVKLGEAARAKAFANIEENGDPEVLARLAPRYENPELGPLLITREDGKAWATFTSGKSSIGTRHNDDGTDSIVLTTPGLLGSAFVIGEKDGKRILRVLDAQHEYDFVESAS
ncbi:serine hydrolase domain-containing protein [Croceibacterium aestuarii]|uniref:serine hydrolase domain-containing protein n=1 Tax=Croceibacterium aestuarii TaxID=3064139 RepID=UPI00272DE7FC|nr:serine hydrolase domain-containing protein [Croceibacterium sp. D39]